LGGWSFQTEYICAVGEQLNGQELFLQGAYFETTYWITGEHRNYLRKLGIFGAVTPLSPLVCLDRCCCDSGIGAWEAKARVSWADFDDDLVQGGEMTVLSAGFNWYYTVRSRFMFDYIHPLLDRANLESTANIFAMRFQVAF
jgi:phosphate-selective porin OprO/OprP